MDWNVMKHLLRNTRPANIQRTTNAVVKHRTSISHHRYC